ncbi:transcription factor IIIB 90 kDa subunit [Halyomorpha halys]|uniref:transcription factor IIIB 90 kDa subunit n=1 Tax=Halyomorpha halys TaxID=286706 RepID=UPI0006D52989
MTGGKCKSCGSSDLEVDPSRGDTVCTNCGTVIEDSVIVSEVQFEENAHGVSSAIGQFVSSDSSGGCRGFGNNFQSGGVRESRELTLQNAKRSISSLCQQLRLNQHCLDTAFNFYKMALSRHLTRGRKHSHIVAACLYITCRIEGTPHLLIDFSDVLQICAFELGRTYLRLSQALCINVPALDPCLYVLRFANKLELGEKTHEVTMTALRLVQRMKRDSMHYGRRPSGICGAALLMASRLHQFNRTVGDIIKVVQVHESTLRKRLVEFGETPSSSLTLQEFMTVDLEEEQDPPSYKAARAKDRERLKMLEDKESLRELNRMQLEIEKQIFDKKKKPSFGDVETTNDEEGDFESFVSSSTIDVIEELEDEHEIAFGEEAPVGLGPSSAVMGLEEGDGKRDDKDFTFEGNGELDLEGIDDKELDMYIMTDVETERKDKIWTERNADYLQKQKEKEEKLRKEMEEGKPPEKKRKKSTSRKKSSTPANSAGEAIEKMLQEKKISTKINYDVLKSLNFNLKETATGEMSAIGLKAEIVPKEEVLSGLEKPHHSMIKDEKPIPKMMSGSLRNKEKAPKEPVIELDADNNRVEDTLDDDDEVEVEETGVISLSEMLNQHRGEDDDPYYGYDEEDY